MSAMDTLCGYVDTSTRSVTADNAIEYAYRELGDGDLPLVLLQHFRGNLDNWDPALIDALATDRRVVTFDNVGVGATTGRTPSTSRHGTRRNRLPRGDGLSTGGSARLLARQLVAQEIALIRPDLVHRVVLASAAPQGAAGMHGWAPEVIGAVGRRRRPPQGYISVFSPPPRRVVRPVSRRPAASSEEGQPTRRTDDVADPTGAYDAVCAWGIPNHSLLQRVAAIDLPGLRRQRRQRPDDPAPLLVPLGRAPPGRAGQDLPGLGPRLSLPAPQRVRRRRARLPSGARPMPRSTCRAVEVGPGRSGNRC